MMKRMQWLALAAAAVLLSVLAPAATPAGAATGYANLCPSLKTALCTPGTVTPSLGFGGVAVDNSSGPSAGDVWVVSYNNQHAANPPTLVKFDSSGNQLAEIGNGNIPSSAHPLLGFGYRHHFLVTDVAVDPANGDVYVSDEENASPGAGTVTKFNSSGVFQYQLTGSETPQGSFLPTGVAVDPSNGDLYVANGHFVSDENSTEVIDKFTSSGTYIGQISVPLAQNAGKGSGSPHSEYGTIAVDPKGNLYVTLLGGIFETNTQVREYSSVGAPVNCPNGDNLLYEDPQFNPNVGAVAVDPFDGHIFIEEFDEGISKSIVAEYGAPCAAPRARVGEGVSWPEGGGFGVSESAHRVYTAGVIFGQVTLPDVATGISPTGVTRTSATVNGTVNPDATAVTTCEFQYGTTTAYGKTVPCSQALPLEGSSPKPVSAEITGLLLPPASAVHYRLRVGNANGDTVGEDQILYTEPLPPPVVGGQPASNVTQFAATLNGTLATGEALVNYRFEYGATTAYGQVAPVPDNYTPITSQTVTVSQPVGGLQAGTTYHYRLLARSP
ncbi:MAG: hypothetical protein ACRDLF_13305, partial [Solirubrobacteraceae bacterium]